MNQEEIENMNGPITSDEIETVAPVTESKVHPANPSEKTQREPATTHEQKSGNGPVVRKLN